MKKLSLLLIMFFLLVSCGGELTPPGPGPDPGPFVPLPPDVIDDIKSPLALVIVKDKSDRTKDEIVGYLLKAQTDINKSELFWKSNKYGIWLISLKGYFMEITPDEQGIPRYGNQFICFFLNGGGDDSKDFLAERLVNDDTSWLFLTQRLVPNLPYYPYILKIGFESVSDPKPRYFYSSNIAPPTPDELPGAWTIYTDYESYHNTKNINAYFFLNWGDSTAEEDAYPSLRSTREVEEVDFLLSFGFPLLGGLKTDGTDSDLHVIDTTKQPTETGYDRGAFIKR